MKEHVSGKRKRVLGVGPKTVRKAMNAVEGGPLERAIRRHYHLTTPPFDAESNCDSLNGTIGNGSRSCIIAVGPK